VSELFHSYGLGQTTQQYLDLITQYESGNKNVYNYKYGTLTPQGLPQTAQGYYQITNQNWNNIAPLLGIDTTQYPSAIYAPQDVQAQVATYLLTQTKSGIGNWANYNPNLQIALNNAGLQTSGPVAAAADTVTPAPAPAPSSGALAPLFDVSGDAATTPTSALMDSMAANPPQQAGLIDLSNPVTDVILAAAGVVAAFLFLGGRNG
jgi:hypothetical protein